VIESKRRWRPPGRLKPGCRAVVGPHRPHAHTGPRPTGRFSDGRTAHGLIAVIRRVESRTRSAPFSRTVRGELHGRRPARDPTQRSGPLNRQSGSAYQPEPRSNTTWSGMMKTSSYYAADVRNIREHRARPMVVDAAVHHRRCALCVDHRGLVPQHIDRNVARLVMANLHRVGRGRRESLRVVVLAAPRPPRSVVTCHWCAATVPDSCSGGGGDHGTPAALITCASPPALSRIETRPSTRLWFSCAGDRGPPRPARGGQTRRHQCSTGSPADGRGQRAL
jgi:hypothetical protein